MTFVIGIDGGGTKTTGIIANNKGEIFAEVTVGASNPNSVEKSQLKNEFTALFTKLQNSDIVAFNKVQHVFAGLSGSDHLETRIEMKQMISGLLPQHIDVSVDNDAITALYSGTLGNPGIVQIAGTGAITYGINSAGNRKRVGGWGYLFGDSGSGYSLGRMALEKVFQAYDGFFEANVLSGKIMNHFKINQVPDLIRSIYHQPNMREKIASLSRIVMEAADEGDDLAIEIIEKNGKHLGESIALLRKQLFREVDSPIPVILVGGLFNRFDLLQSAIESGLATAKENVTLIVPNILPVGGSVIAALKKADIRVDEKEFINNFSR